MFLLGLLKKYYVPIFVVMLFFIPFFWLKIGEMDLGGDSNRLFFYDPISFIKNISVYTIFTEGRGVIEPNYYFLPYVAFIAFLKIIFKSPTIVIGIINGFKLAGGFLFVYLIVRDVLKGTNKQNDGKAIYASILAGLFYIVSFGSLHLSVYWDRAITAHNQIFINPLMFYLGLKYLLLQDFRYVLMALLVSFIFAPNFGLTAAPAFFAFYPIAFLFLLLYARFFIKHSIPWKGIGSGVILFFGVQAFQFLGQAVSLFDPGSFSNAKVFSGEEILIGGLNYFVAVHHHGMVVLNLLLPSSVRSLQWTSLTAPMLIIAGLVVCTKRKKELLFIVIFFMITLFLVSANVTTIGYLFYRSLYYIPGFSMFRVFFEKWAYIYVFFYALVFGFSIYSLFSSLRQKYVRILCGLIFFIWIIVGWPIFSGDLSHQYIRGSNNVRGVFRMDPRFEQTLSFVKDLSDDGKILALPLTDNFRQVVMGIDGGAYEGPSMFAHLAGKYSFVGYQYFGYNVSDPAPYAEQIMKYSREKNYERLLQIFTTLNIRYIYHDADPKAYEEGFAPGSFGYMMTSLPKTQAEYKEFLTHFPISRIYENGPYSIYKMNEDSYNPTIFIPQDVYQSNTLLFDATLLRSTFISDETCVSEAFKELCRENYSPAKVDIQFMQINPTVYKVTVQDFKVKDSIFLVMQHTFHPSWKVRINGKVIAEDRHIRANGYANGWLIKKDELPLTNSFTLDIVMEHQKYFWYGWVITAISLLIVVIAFIASFILYGKKT